MNNIGYFGGSFDPIHLGHIAVAKKALKELNLSFLYFMPNNNQPFKNKLTPYKYRVEMIKLAIENYKYFSISYEEEEEKIHYTSQTLKKIFNENAKNYLDKFKLYFIMGEDSFDQIETWFEFEKIFNYTSLAVFPRKSSNDILADKCFDFSKKFNVEVKVINSKIYNISSSEIRGSIRDKKKLNECLPTSVEEYIIKNGIYV